MTTQMDRVIKDLEELELHRNLQIGGWSIMKVPGGLIYSRGTEMAVFVPFPPIQKPMQF